MPVTVKTNKTEPLVQYILFAALVVATPFVVVTKFLQGAVHNISHWGFPFLSFKLPVVGTLAVLGIIALAVWQRREIKLRRIIACLVIAGMIGLSQWLQDLYGNMSIYDLQKNWHYLAYSAYVFVFFRAFYRRGMPIPRMILYSFFSAISLSFFDEIFQYRMSHRIFDVSDIAKDSWGAMMGLILVLFVSETYGRVDFKKCSWHHPRIRLYLRDPLSAMLVTGLLSLCFIVISPLITDHPYIGLFFGLSLVVFIVVFAIWHLLQFKKFRIFFGVLAGMALVLLSTSFLINRNEGITAARYGFVSYKGLPAPFFDLMIYPNGLPRLVDKKHFFNNQDRQFMFLRGTDIIIIGSGFRGKGGKGFQIEEGVYFDFNRFTRRGVQIIIQPTDMAVKTFNRLRISGKRILFIIHSTS